MKKYQPDPKLTFFRLERIKPSHPAWIILQDPDVFRVFMLACYYTTFKSGRGIGQFTLKPIPGMNRERKRKVLQKLERRGVVRSMPKNGLYKMGETSPLLLAKNTGKSFIMVNRGPELLHLLQKDPEILMLEMWMRFRSFQDDLCVLATDKVDILSRKKVRGRLEKMEKEGVISFPKWCPEIATLIATPCYENRHTDRLSHQLPPTVVKFLTKRVCESDRVWKLKKGPGEGQEMGVKRARGEASILEGKRLEGSKLEGKTIRYVDSPDLATDEPPSLTEDLPTSSVDLPVAEARPSVGPASEQFSLEAEALSQDFSNSSPASPTRSEYGRSSDTDLAIRTSRLVQKLEVLPHLEQREHTALWNFMYMRLEMGEPTNSRDMNELFHMLYNPEYPEIWIQYFEQLVQDQNPKFNPGSLGSRYSKAMGEELEQLLGSSQAYTYYIQLKQYLLPSGDLAMEKKWKHRDDPEAWALDKLEGCRKQMNEPFAPARVEACAMRLLCEQQEWRQAGAKAVELSDKLMTEDPDLQNATAAFALNFYSVRPKHKRDSSGFRR